MSYVSFCIQLQLQIGFLIWQSLYNIQILKDIMQKEVLTKLINFRRQLHTYPQISMKEFQTHQRIKKILLDFGVKQESIREVKPTGLIVDLKGQAEPQGKNICVAFRADMDALSMQEENLHLPYKSQNNGAAHMCGHDGHVTCLVGFVPLYMQQIKNVPSNKTIRLLFQPSQQGPAHGAELLIENGCLQEVDEVYGFHNWPIGKFGDIWCKEGPVMSKITVIKVKIIGTGGHGSQPQNLKVAIGKGIQFYQKIIEFTTKLKQQSGKFFVCTLPVFQSGQRYNVISESVTIQGSTRTFDADICSKINDKIRSVCAEIQAEGFKVELSLIESCLTANSKKESDNVLRVARQYLGEDRVGSGSLPFKASEDFGYYTMIKPGAFFFFCTKKEQNQVFLHNPRFNFKDELIETASTFWFKLALDRIKSE